MRYETFRSEYQDKEIKEKRDWLLAKSSARICGRNQRNQREINFTRDATKIIEKV